MKPTTRSLPGLTIAVGAAVLITACSSSQSGPAPSPRSSVSGATRSSTAATASSGTAPPGTVTVDCKDPITTLDVPEPGTQAVLDAVALATTVPSYDTASPGDPHRFFAKTGLAIRVGRPVVLAVAATAAGSVSIFWGNRSAQWGASLSVPACPAGTGEHGRWIVLPGGFWVDRPTCVPLTVTAGGRARTVRVGVGTRCAAR